MVARERTATADVLAHLAEFDERKRYLPDGYPSMYAYCVGALRLCEQAAYERITAARAARFPRPDVLAWVAPVPASPVTTSTTRPSELDGARLSPGRVEAPPISVSEPIEPPRLAEEPGGPRRLKPLSAETHAVQFPLGRHRHDLLRYAQELLGHGSASGHGCEARKALEFDHVEPYARGGTATVSGIRLRCRAHNQFEAERAYGPEFMRHKRLAAVEGRGAAAEGSNDRDVGTAGA